MKEPPTVTPGTTAGSSTHDALDLLGKKVRVEEAGTVIRVGYVETATPSGTLFWIAASGCEPRRLYGSALGQSITPLPESGEAAGTQSAPAGAER
jgi:hypothetical protein